MITLRPALAPLLAPVRRWYRRVLLRRRPLAALAAGGAVLVGLQAASPPPPATVAVVAAGRDLPGGSTLSAGDLHTVRLAPEAVPTGAVVRADEVLGRTLAAPLSQGEVLTDRRALGPGLLSGYPGRTAVPVRVTDPDVVDLLRVGDRVTLVVADPDARSAPEVLAERVPVAALPRRRASAFATGTPGRLVVVAVDDAVAREVAGRAIAGYVTVVWD